MAKIEYIRCPRCELNYIDKKEKLCKVCKMELSSSHNHEEEEVEQGICPICKINVINEDEEMCPMCAKEMEVQQGGQSHTESDADDTWRSYVENDDVETETDEIGDMSSIQDEDELLDDIPLDDEDLDDSDFGDDDDDESFDDDEDFSADDDDLNDDDLDDDYDEDEDDDDLDDDLADDDDEYLDNLMPKKKK